MPTSERTLADLADEAVAAARRDPDTLHRLVRRLLEEVNALAHENARLLSLAERAPPGAPRVAGWGWEVRASTPVID